MNSKELIVTMSESMDEMLRMISRASPDVRPPSGKLVRCKTDDGNDVMLDVAATLKMLATWWYHVDGPSDEAIAEFSKFAWAPSWIETEVSRPDAIKRSRSVSKQARIQLLRLYYHIEQPSWKDEIPVLMPDGGVWVFKPVQWLDDVSNVWLGGKSAVVLNEKEKEMMETLPWLGTWLKKLSEKREKRSRKRALSAYNCDSNAVLNVNNTRVCVGGAGSVSTKR